MTLVVPGMTTNTNTKDTIWIGKFDVKERISNKNSKNSGNKQNSGGGRRFFRLSLVRMITGSHMLISPDRKVYTVVVPLPDVFSSSSSSTNSANINKEVSLVETVSLLTAATIPQQQLTDAQKRQLLASTNEMELKLKNALLIQSQSRSSSSRGAASNDNNSNKPQQQQVEVVGVLDVRKLSDEDRRNRSGKNNNNNNNHSQLQEERRKRSKLSSYGSYLCSLSDKNKSEKTEKVIRSNPNGIDLVLEMTLVRKDGSSLLGDGGTGGTGLPQALSNSAFIWLLFFALALGLIVVIWNAIAKSTSTVPGSFASSSSFGSSSLDADGDL